MPNTGRPQTHRMRAWQNDETTERSHKRQRYESASEHDIPYTAGHCYRACDNAQPSRMREWSDETTVHTEGGWYIQVVGSDSSFVNRDADITASVALAEGHLGDGIALFNEDGSLAAAVTPRSVSTVHSNKRREYDTATEHDMPNTARYCNTAEQCRTMLSRAPQRGTATVHAERNQMEEAHAQRNDNAIKTLCYNLIDFLSEMVREAYSTPSRCWALAENVENIVDDKITERLKTTQVYEEAELLLHMKVYDVMSHHKEGTAKENKFVDWCRRVHSHACDHTCTATEHTVHSLACKALALDILSNDLTPEQARNPTCKIREDKSITSKQRSTINAILRKNLGDGKVVDYIWNCGLRTLLDVHMRPPTTAIIQNMLDEFMTWYQGLLQSILRRRNHPDMADAHKLSDLKEKDFQMQRRQEKEKTKRDLKQGELMAKALDCQKKS